jgi:hypothetical protein
MLSWAVPQASRVETILGKILKGIHDTRKLRNTALGGKKWDNQM